MVHSCGPWQEASVTMQTLPTELLEHPDDMAADSLD